MLDIYGSVVPLNEQGEWEKEQYPFYKSVTLMNGTMFKVGMFRTITGRIFIGIENHGAYTFETWVHWGYASEKLALLPGDARPIADFINCQLGLYDPEKTQGDYTHLKTYVGQD